MALDHGNGNPEKLVQYAKLEFSPEVGDLAALTASDKSLSPEEAIRRIQLVLDEHSNPVTYMPQERIGSRIARLGMRVTEKISAALDDRIENGIRLGYIALGAIAVDYRNEMSEHPGLLGVYIPVATIFTALVCKEKRRQRNSNVN